MITSQAIFLMGLAALLCVIIPLSGFLLLRRHHEIKLSPILFGALFFILFVLVLEPVMHQLVLRPQANGTISLIKTAPALYVLYGVLAAGIFEESARGIAFTTLKSVYQTQDSALAYGIGHGGIEALLLGGLSSLSNLIISLMLNTHQALPLPKATVTQLTQLPAWQFILPAIERLPAFVIQVCLSVIVWQALKQKKIRLFFTAIAIHAIIDLPSAMMQVSWLHNYFILYGLLYGMAALLVYFTFKTYF
ncbi:YhfC family intramembrane metalloprotease [Enterococcus sp. CSURQ0835]|uniref:YhfC family intramembrane metalloprotease n=1 Tax=Enterococcus sp. CSURQ0835 TaxID=2681394 RepID=UPI00135BBFB5|nr:YhfC family glutamic-type intramembrane protease [Enterococcus sp. CSURQ0835]